MAIYLAVCLYVEKLTVIVMLKVMLIGSIKPWMLHPGSLADIMAEPIALYVALSDLVWLSLIGNRVLSAYNEKRIPTLLLVILPNVFAGIAMAFMDVLDLKESLSL